MFINTTFLWQKTAVIYFFMVIYLLMLCFHRSRPSTADRIRHQGLIVLVFGARITSGLAISCRFFIKTALKTSSQVTAGHPRSPQVTGGGRTTNRRLPMVKHRLSPDCRSPVVAGHHRSPQAIGDYLRSASTTICD